MKSWLEMRRHGRFMRHWVSVQGKDANATDQELAVGKKEYDAYEAIGEQQVGFMCVFDFCVRV